MAEPTLFKNGGLAWSTATTTAAPFTQIPGVKSVEVPLSKAELANGVMSDNGEVFFPGLISAPVTDHPASDVRERYRNRREALLPVERGNEVSAPGLPGCRAALDD